MASATTSTYESARAANIRRNQALLAELNLQTTAAPKTARPPPPKRRKLDLPAPPSRTSARIAASSQPRPVYNEDAKLTPESVGSRLASTGRSVTSRRMKSALQQNQRSGRSKDSEGSATGTVADETSIDVSAVEPSERIAEIMAGWTAWEATADPPTRDSEGTIHFADEPTFLPNKTPAEMLREGAFGGSYYHPLRSRRLGVVVEGDWEELPSDWIDGLDVDTFLASSEYNPEINKYKVACGQSIEEWEAAGWINHEFDVRGWFQWYSRFYRGRRCDDDERQISRWRKCVGETGRWRRMLLKKYKQLGVRSVFDDGEDEDAPEVSPVVHQTCHHWAWEVRQETLDAYWAES